MTVRSERGAGSAGRMWARRELGRRRWQLVALGLLAGIAAAVALSSVAGARRSATAWERFSDETLAADAVVFASQADVFGPDVDWSDVAALPYVESAGSFGIPFVDVVDGPDGAQIETAGMFSVPFGTWRSDIDRPIVLEGRLPDPDDPHEVLAPAGANAYGIAVGQEYVIRVPSEEQIAAMDIFGTAEGPEVRVEVVGIGRSAFELATIPGDGAGWFTTPAFHDQYSSSVTFIDNLLVRFRPGQGSVELLERDVREIFDSPNMPVLDAEAASKRVTNGTGLEAIGLLLFGSAVALAGAVLVGQALTRSVRAGAADIPTLAAMGFTRPDGARALAAPHLVVVAVAAFVAFGGAVALSPRFPIGLARRIDPLHGVQIDWLVLGVGVALMTAALVLTVALTSHRATAAASTAAVTRRPMIVRLVGGTSAPPSVVVGTNLALEAGNDRRALPTRSALAGVVVGIVGVVAAQTMLVAMDDAIDHPARFGSTWDLELAVNDHSGFLVYDDAMATVESDRAVVASALSGRSLLVVDGVTQPVYSIAPRVGALDFTVLSGRSPRSPGEIALGPETAASYGVAVGEHVTVTASDGADHSLEVVGLALLPTTPHSNYDQGGWVTPAEQERLAGAPMGELPDGADPTTSTPPISPLHLADLAEGADVTAARDRIASELDQAIFDLQPPEPTLDASNLRNVRSLPMLFSVFTVLLAIGTVAHVSTSVVRRRGAEFAVLRAIGMTSRNLRAALAWQATTLSLIGLLVGLPVGVVVGRVVWRVVADHTPLVFGPPLALVALCLAIPGALVVANLIAAVPGRRVSRLRPADVLRHE